MLRKLRRKKQAAGVGAYLTGHFDSDTAAQHASALRSAGVTADMAAELTLAEMRELLPGASVGDRVRILRSLRDTAQADERPALPNTPSWCLTRRYLTNGENVREKSYAWADSNIVTSSLILGMSAAALLDPIDCDDAGPGCATLRAADLIAWMLTTVLLTLSTLGSTVTTASLNLLTDEELPGWLVANWHVQVMPLAFFVIAMSFAFPLALSLRMWGIADSTPVAAALSVLAGTIAAGYHAVWHPPARAIAGVSWRDWFSWPHGANWTYTFATPRAPSGIGAPRPSGKLNANGGVLI